MKTLLKLLSSLCLAVVIALAGFTGYLSITEYRPEPITPVQTRGIRGAELAHGNEFTLTSFNIGYGALDQETDFFLDGGSMSRGISRERIVRNIGAIVDFLTLQDSDIFLIQEVDESATRSYNVNQREIFVQALPHYSSSFALNYKVPWVPLPLKKPMGKVRSGLLTLSRYAVEQSTRHSLPGQYPWPTRLAQLDRCLLETRLPLAEGGELVIGHIHLSAFDQGGFIRNQQLEFLAEYASKEYQKGNYVVLGGDWNHLLAENPEEVQARQSANWPFWLQLLPQDFLPDFQWAFAEDIPSVRSMDSPYQPHKSFTATIDGFLLSPNIQLVEVENHDLGFRYSDHNPVSIKLRLPEPKQEKETNIDKRNGELQTSLENENE